MKNSMSIVDVYAWVCKTGKLIEKCYINNVYHSNVNTIIFKLYCKHLSYNPLLIMEAGRRIHLTKYTIPKEHKITSLCSALRKHLRRLIIESVELVGWERIVKITIASPKRKYYLYVELLPRGIIVLTDENNVILHTTRTLELKDRVIRRGKEYKLPPPLSVNPLKANVEEVSRAVLKGKDIIRGLVRGLGLPSELAEETCFRVKIDKYTSSKEIPFNIYEKIIKTIREIIEEAKEGLGYIVLKNAELITVLPFKPTYLAEKYSLKMFSDFNEALDLFFTEKMKRETIAKIAKAKEREVKRLEYSLEKAKKLKEKYSKEAINLRHVGNLILKNIDSISKIIECFRRRDVRRKEEEAVKICSMEVKEPSIRILGFNRNEGIVEVEIEGKTVKVSIRKSAYENASKCFEKAKELQRKVSKIEEKIRELKEKIEKLEREVEYAKVEEKAKVRKKEWYEKYHWIIKGKYLIIGGRNAEQNESIVKKHLEANDIFIHAEIHGAPAVIIKSKGPAPKDVIREAALIAAAYSRAWKEGLGVADVYWVWGKQVSKKPPPGEYLPKGAFMIYGKRNYIRNIPLILALGIEKVNESLRIIVGSEEHVKEKALAYVILKPGHISPHKLANEIKNILIKKAPKELEPLLKTIPVEEIALRIPGPSVIRKTIINTK